MQRQGYLAQTAVLLLCLLTATGGAMELQLGRCVWGSMGQADASALPMPQTEEAFPLPALGLLRPPASGAPTLKCRWAPCPPAESAALTAAAARATLQQQQRTGRSPRSHPLLLPPPRQASHGPQPSSVAGRGWLYHYSGSSLGGFLSLYSRRVCPLCSSLLLPVWWGTLLAHFLFL